MCVAQNCTFSFCCFFNQFREVETKVCFIEVVNEDPAFLMQQYHLVATTSPDYAGIDPAVAVSCEW